MADLIDRQAAIEIACNSCPYECAHKRMPTRFPPCHTIEQIIVQPAVEAEPVRCGQWVSEKVRKPDWKGVEHDYFQPNSCSVCHTGFAVRTNFCPNCGARMDATDTNVGGKGGADNG